MASSKKKPVSKVRTKKKARKKPRAGDKGRSKTPPTSVRFSPDEEKQIAKYKKGGIPPPTAKRIYKRMCAAKKFASSAQLIRASLGFE